VEVGLVELEVRLVEVEVGLVEVEVRLVLHIRGRDLSDSNILTQHLCMLQSDVMLLKER